MNSVRISAAALVCIVVSAAFAQSPAGASNAPQVFDTPQAAADAVFRACGDDDTAALVRIFGRAYAEFARTIDPVVEKEHRRELRAESQAALQISQPDATHAEILIGPQQWPFPVPLVKDSRGWVFETERGLREIRARRIAAGEAAAAAVCLAYLKAQLEYAAEARQSTDVYEYAQRIASSPGKRDGLYWAVDAASDEPLSPLGPGIAQAEAAGKQGKPSDAYLGYYFKILTRQGSNAPVGKYDYVINGHMIAGFALVAWPAEYGVTGNRTFVISQQGKLLAKDLGRDTAGIVKRMNEYNPDKTWQPAQP